MKFKYGILFLLVSVSVSYAQEKTFTSKFGIEFILIQPGTMTVGKFEPTVDRPANPKDRLPDSLYVKAEKLAKAAYLPGFEVKLDNPYYIGKFEITQAQWTNVMGTNPSVFTASKVSDDVNNHPVENVTWKDIQLFLKKLNKLDKEHTYRLPTEFEWEFAARAGNKDDIAWKEIFETAVLSGKTTTAVGSKKPNAWGLYDMLGNVWEWVHDVYNEKIFADPVPPEKGKQHVLKGSSFTGDVKNATYMNHSAGPGNGFDVGFRIVMEVKSGGNHKSSSPSQPMPTGRQARTAMSRFKGYAGSGLATALQLPEGFNSIFNGKNLKGWHISRTTHQGTTPNFYVENGVMVVTQQPYGQGGVLLTDKKYKNFELYMEVKIDSFTNGGIFIRSTESGVAYQIELDETAKSTGSLYGERMGVSKSMRAEKLSEVWKKGGWNSFRLRMTGDIPHLTLWINGIEMWDVTQPENDFINEATEGMIGLQSHWTALYSSAAGTWDHLESWAPGAKHRYRNIGVKELP
jgi:formylglycine-generating enzyme